MKKLYQLVTILVIGLFNLHPVLAQTHTPHYNTSIAPNSNGFYEYLPQGYDPSGTQTYPLIIFIHGFGEVGNGNPGQLPRLFQAGLPRLINQGNFPSSFSLNGQTFRFIVISAQFSQWPTVNDIESVLNYSIQNYKVNQSRVYLTGLSMGGGMTWEYAGFSTANATRLAAIIPVCGASWPDHQKADNIAAANLPVWATHNSGDPQVPVWYTDSMIQFINQAPIPPSIPARKTIFQSNSHNAWTQTYDPSFTENGLNIFQWMLQYTRNNGVLPVTLSSYTVTKSSARQALIRWTTTDEFNNDHFTVERSSDGLHFTPLGTITAQNAAYSYSFTDAQPLQGDNFYRLSQTDFNGSTTRFEIYRLHFDLIGKNKISLYPVPAGNQVRVSLEHEEKGMIRILLLSSAGNTVKEWQFNKQQTDWYQDLDVNSLPSGTYILQIKGKRINETGKLIRL